MSSKKGFTRLIKVESQALEFISYHEDDEVLLVRYKGGSDFHYKNVPKYVFKELVSANKNEKASVGKLFLNLVKNNPDRPGEKV